MKKTRMWMITTIAVSGCAVEVAEPFDSEAKSTASCERAYFRYGSVHITGNGLSGEGTQLDADGVPEYTSTTTVNGELVRGAMEYRLHGDDTIEVSVEDQDSGEDGWFDFNDQVGSAIHTVDDITPGSYHPQITPGEHLTLDFAYDIVCQDWLTQVQAGVDDGSVQPQQADLNSYRRMECEGSRLIVAELHPNNPPIYSVSAFATQGGRLEARGSVVAIRCEGGGEPVVVAAPSDAARIVIDRSQGATVASVHFTH